MNPVALLTPPLSHPDLEPSVEAAIRENFERQRVMATLGARLGAVAPGRVEIILPFCAELTQQQGFLHAGIVTALLDSACGYAALSLMPQGSDVLSVEFKVNLLSPARGEAFSARGLVRRAGRTLSVCQGELFAVGDEDKPLALMQATMFRVRTPGAEQGQPQPG